MLWFDLSQLLLIVSITAKQIVLHLQLHLQSHDAGAPLVRRSPFAAFAPISGGLADKTPPRLGFCHLFLYRDSEIFGGLLSRICHNGRSLCVERGWSPLSEIDVNDVTALPESGAIPEIGKAQTWSVRSTRYYSEYRYQYYSILPRKFGGRRRREG